MCKRVDVAVNAITVISGLAGAMVGCHAQANNGQQRLGLSVKTDLAMDSKPLLVFNSSLTSKIFIASCSRAMRVVG